MTPKTLLTRPKLDNLLTHLMLTKEIPGTILELGVYQGGSLTQMAQNITTWGKSLIGIDTFEGLPFTGPDSRMWETRFNDVDSIKLVQHLQHYPFVSFVRGEFPLCIKKLTHCTKISFAHIDMDLGLPTLAAFNWIDPLLSPGGRLVLDDYMWPETPDISTAISYFLAMTPNTYDVTYYEKDHQAMLRKVSI